MENDYYRKSGQLLIDELKKTLGKMINKKIELQKDIPELQKVIEEYEKPGLSEFKGKG